MIAALYVETGGGYFGLPSIEPWDEAKDARAYAGPHPVVAHPPCQRWGKSEARLDPAVVERMGLKRAKRLGEVGARGGGTDSSPRIGTPAEFRDLLISIAGTAVLTAHDRASTRGVA